jgi:hypothetical protein
MSFFGWKIKSSHLCHFWSKYQIISGCSHSRFSTEINFHHLLLFLTFSNRSCCDWFRFMCATLMFKSKISTSLLASRCDGQMQILLLFYLSLSYTMVGPTFYKHFSFTDLVYNLSFASVAQRNYN